MVSSYTNLKVKMCSSTEGVNIVDFLGFLSFIS
ncbi:hypothetical protein E2C01_090245 [Portunus trituberculatus]|uniref:Uncharacterized protein n=1 Tax=Portunus trituberculatus TaxID=210409 RepID=A0A5B7JAY6_PORTR|nr:hypothetical protein [Portunus trituberculatus]